MAGRWWRLAVAVVTATVAGACQLEVVAIFGERRNVRVLREVPTISRVSGRWPPFGIAVLSGLAAHFWLARMLAWLMSRRADSH